MVVWRGEICPTQDTHDISTTQTICLYACCLAVQQLVPRMDTLCTHTPLRRGSSTITHPGSLLSQWYPGTATWGLEYYGRKEDTLRSMNSVAVITGQDVGTEDTGPLCTTACSHAVHGMVPWYLHVQRTCYYMITCMVPCRWSCRAYPPTTSPERASAGHPVDASLESRTQGVMTSCHPV